MIGEVDSALRTLIEREAVGRGDVEVVFDAPTREWAGRRNSPTIDVYLYDIREDMRRRDRGMINEYDADERRVVARHLPPRYFKLSYLVTAWTQRPEDEHRLLSTLLLTFLRFDALPADLLTGSLAELDLEVPVTVALPPPEDRAFADVWSALGGELKPSIDVVVSAPVDTGQRYRTGPPVTVPPRVSLGGSNGWPPVESTVPTERTAALAEQAAALAARTGASGPRSAAGAGGGSDGGSGGAGASDGLGAGGGPGAVLSDTATLADRAAHAMAQRRGGDPRPAGSTPGGPTPGDPVADPAAGPEDAETGSGPGGPRITIRRQRRTPKKST